MNQIKGKITEAICYTDIMDKEAYESLKTLCDHELFKDRHIRIMPDVHANGDGTVTGFTMIHREPIILGIELGSGCGVSLAALEIPGSGLINGPDEPEPDYQKLDEVCHEIPTGKNTFWEPAFDFDFSRLNCYKAISHVYEWPGMLGCLGGGNHFIEMDRDDEGHFYLVVHNGLGSLSRPAVEYYLDAALRKAGKTRTDACLEDTCLYGKEMADFLHDMALFVELCKINRKYMTEFIVSRMGYHITGYTDICHHIIDQSDNIIRHGAIAARPGEKVVIPINARDGCILGTGKGNPEWNYSAPHGAGRRLSRREAREKLDMETYNDAMKDVHTSSVHLDNLDEAPDAYKPIKSIINAVRDSVEIEQIIRPVYNYKG